MREDIENRLFECRNISEFLTMFFGLSYSDKVNVFSMMVPVDEGMFFYRARRACEFVSADPNEKKQWGPPPANLVRRKGRFNLAHESVLYVASTPDTLERELRLDEGEEYYLAKYVCKRSFEVGSFLNIENPTNILIHKVTMAIADSSDLTEKENALIDEYYEWARNRDLKKVAMDMLSPLYIHKQLTDIYDATNKLGKLVLRRYKYGFRYSSVFSPLESSGGPIIFTMAGVDYGNYLLTQKGYECIELVSVEKKKAGKIQELDVMINQFADSEKKKK